MHIFNKSIFSQMTNAKRKMLLPNLKENDEK